MCPCPTARLPQRHHAALPSSLLGGELGSCSGFVRGAAEPCLSKHKAPQFRSDTSSGDSSEKREWKEEPRSVRGPRGCDSHHAVQAQQAARLRSAGAAFREQERTGAAGRAATEPQHQTLEAKKKKIRKGEAAASSLLSLGFFPPSPTPQRHAGLAALLAPWNPRLLGRGHGREKSNARRCHEQSAPQKPGTPAPGAKG